MFLIPVIGGSCLHADIDARRREKFPQCLFKISGQSLPERRLVTVFEKGGARDEGICSGLSAQWPGALINASVHFEAKPERFLPAPVVDLRDFLQATLVKGLTPKSWLHRHDQGQIDVGQIRFKRCSRGGRVDYEAALATQIPDFSERLGHRNSRWLDMDADQISSIFGKCLNILLGIIEHEVDIKEQLVPRLLAKTAQRFRPEGEIGHKMPVHDVEVNPAAACVDDGLHALGKSGVIPGEDRRCEDWIGQSCGSVLHHQVL